MTQEEKKKKKRTISTAFSNVVLFIITMIWKQTAQQSGATQQTSTGNKHNYNQHSTRNSTSK